MKKTLALAAIALAGLTSANAQLLFTQYYEGSAGTNKWIEITNTGATSIDLSIYTVSLYTNAAAESWKLGTTSSSNFALSGSLAAGATLVLGNSAATPTPSYLTAGTFTAANTVANFNGNDSLVLWNDSAAYSTSQIVDAIGFTNAGNEGLDTSFVRLNAGAGYNLTAGSTVLTFPSVWSQQTLATVNGATAGTNNYIGYSSVSSVPEPGSALLVGCAGLGFCLFFRKRKLAA
jgi:predicted extracellular nuclease